MYVHRTKSCSTSDTLLSFTLNENPTVFINDLLWTWSSGNITTECEIAPKDPSEQTLLVYSCVNGWFCFFYQTINFFYCTYIYNYIVNFSAPSEAINMVFIDENIEKSNFLWQQSSNLKHITDIVDSSFGALGNLADIGLEG